MGEVIQKIEIGQPEDGESVAYSTMQRYPLTVLVVGAGVGGLTVALECYRKGHNVRIFGREPSISTAGKHSGIYHKHCYA
jgi:heterodisulfide reductase subunit A-like polyferredoxin